MRNESSNVFVVCIWSVYVCDVRTVKLRELRWHANSLRIKSVQQGFPVTVVHVPAAFPETLKPVVEACSLQNMQLKTKFEKPINQPLQTQNDIDYVASSSWNNSMPSQLCTPKGNNI